MKNTEEHIINYWNLLKKIQNGKTINSAENAPN